MKHDRAFGLSGDGDDDADQVGREGRPNIGLDFRNRATVVGDDFERLLVRDNQVISIHFPAYAETLHDDFDHIKILHARVADTDIALRDNRRTDKANYFEIIRTDSKFPAV